MDSFPYWSIPTKDMPRCEWLDIRRMGIGGSDAAVVCGKSPWDTRRGLYEKKLGNVHDSDFEAEHLEWGHRLEPAIRAAIEDKTGYKTEPVNEMLWSRKWPNLFVDLDGVVYGNGKHFGVLEIKTTWRMDEDWGRDGTDEIPICYRLQCEHAMLVSGLEWCVLAVLVAGSKFHWYEFQRSEKISSRLVQLESEFWSCIEGENPPAFDCGHKSTGELLVQLWPDTEGEVYLPQESMSWHETFQALSEQEKISRAGKDGVKNLLVSHMGNAKVGILPDGTRYERSRNKAGVVTFRHRG